MEKEERSPLLRIGISAVLTGLICLLPIGEEVRFFLLLIPYLLVGFDVLSEAWEGLRKREPFDECFLMAVATLGALLLKQPLEAVAVMLFYQLGEWFQDTAADKSHRSIEALLVLHPDSANVEDENGAFHKTAPEEVAVGTVILVEPGERIPIDGVVLTGQSTLDTSALTGESVPRTIRPGDTVCSGCVNLTGLLRLRTTKAFGESTASKILELVENARERKAGSERFISRFAAVYTPVVCGSALALAVLPPLIRLLLGMAPLWSTWVYRALTFLVISCPCALVAGIPLTFFAALGGAGKAGILVKGSNYLEALAKVRTVAFDKTGTLTEGTFSVSEVCAVGCTEAELLRLAAAAERYSNHPISRSLQAAAKSDDAAVTDAREYSGKGVTATVNGCAVAVGNILLMQKLGIKTTPSEKPGTVVYVAANGEFLGWIRISDRVKAGSAEAVQALKKLGVRQTVLLTGDERRTAEAVAEELGIETVYAELLPADKVARIEALMEEDRSGTLAFAGDGMNDAPVLARADVGIAMGALGSDAAIEAADVVVMDDDMRSVAKAVRIAKKCMRIVYENIGFTIGVKVLCLLLGALGLVGMWAAVFADVGVMVLAVLNAIRALRV